MSKLREEIEKILCQLKIHNYKEISSRQVDRYLGEYKKIIVWKSVFRCRRCGKQKTKVDEILEVRSYYA